MAVELDSQAFQGRVEHGSSANHGGDSAPSRLTSRPHTPHHRHPDPAARCTRPPRGTAVPPRRPTGSTALPRTARSACWTAQISLLIPGALQSESYIRAVFSSGTLTAEDIDKRTAARLERAELLANVQHQFSYVITHGALGWRPVGSPEAMAAQLKHLIDVSQRPNVRLGVIPWGTPATVFPPCGFDVYDSRTVVVGVVGGAAYYTDPGDVSRYIEMLTKLEALAVYGDDVRALLVELAPTTDQ